MKIVEVSSSAVLKLGYDGDFKRALASRDTLFVQFVGGKWYKYFHVPEDVFKRFCEADSVGQFFNEEIKPNYTEFEPCVFNPVP